MGEVQGVGDRGRIERAFDKRDILEQYLNRVYYGNGAWGAEAAARFYFGKPAAALSLGEGAFLAVLPRGPGLRSVPPPGRGGSPAPAHPGADGRSAGLVSPADRELAERTPLVFRREHPELRAPHFVEHVLAQLARRPRLGVTVETTLDWPLQNRVEIALRDHLETVGGRGISQAGLVVIRNSDGAVLAMVGSRDYFDTRRAGAVNVTTILRRPGSTLKPFVYGLALEAGDSPATLAYDVVLPGETRETYTHEVKQHGLGRYRESLAGSYNLAAVHTLARVGPASLVERLSRAGMTTFTDPPRVIRCRWRSARPSSASSNTRARSRRSATAAAPWSHAPITRVRVPGGQTYAPRAAAEPPRVFSPEIAYLVFDMLAIPTRAGRCSAAPRRCCSTSRWR